MCNNNDKKGMIQEKQKNVIYCDGKPEFRATFGSTDNNMKMIVISNFQLECNSV